MRQKFFAVLFASSMLAISGTGQAQDLTAMDVAAMRAEIAALRAQVQSLEALLDAVATTPDAATGAQTEVDWKGAPELSRSDGWRFKPRGRIQVDVAGIDAPTGVLGNRGGAASEFRRLYLGVDGQIPGGFGYRLEADIANGSVDLTDVYLTYGTGPLTVMAGQTKPFWSLDEMTSDLFTSFTERAAFAQAFGFERRVGLSAQYRGKLLLVQGGVFGDNSDDLLNDANNSISFDARAVFMPKIGSTQLHLGGSGHWRDFNDAATSTRYRARPFVHTADMRLVDTGTIAASGERGLGLEAAALNGPLHVAGEGFWQTARRPGAADPTFFGGYVEAGIVLTAGDKRGYKDGAFDRLRPRKDINQGGIGAIEVNARYDYLDLNDGGVRGGKQQMAGISLVWTPIQYVRIIANYGHLTFVDAAVATPSSDRSYSADVFGLRTQLDF